MRNSGGPGTAGVGILTKDRENLARNRYGWQKRAKEMGYEEKHDEKMKRLQGKPTTSATVAYFL